MRIGVVATLYPLIRPNYRNQYRYVDISTRPLYGGIEEKSMANEEKDKIVAYVYETYNYGKFKKLVGNRPVYDSRLKRLINSFEQNPNIINPGIVNESNEIIEGQGRFESRRTLGLPFHYIRQANLGIDECKLLNKYNTVWKQLDYVIGEAETGNENYQRFLECLRTNCIPVSRALSFACKTTDRSKNALINGTLIFTDADYKHVCEMVSMTNEMVSALDIKQNITENFFRAAKICINTLGYKHNRMLKACQKHRNSFVRTSTLKDQLVEFSKIYNSGYTSKIFFEDYMRGKGYSTRTYENNGPSVSSLLSNASISSLNENSEGE